MARKPNQTTAPSTAPATCGILTGPMPEIVTEPDGSDADSLLEAPAQIEPRPGPLRNNREENFVQNLLSGDSQRVAYRKAFPRSQNWKDKTVDCRACELANRGDILGRLSELKAQSASAKVMARQERMEVLTEIARSQAEVSKARMQAIDILNKMDGDYVRKIEASVSADTSEVAEKVRAILAGDGA